MQVYFRLDKDLEQWYNLLPPRGRSVVINDTLRAGRDTLEGKEDKILEAIKNQTRELTELITSSSIKITAIRKAEPNPVFDLSQFESMAVIEDE